MSPPPAGGPADEDRVPIGEFARRSGLTPKALRLYDELELLPPDAVDPRSGHRTYRATQLARARLIAALRGVGMPLARIRAACDAGAATAVIELRSYWRQAEADHRARGDQVRLLLEALRQEDGTMDRSSTTFTLDHAVRRHPGLVREHDEDAALVRGALVAVSDGFGSPTGSATPSPGARASSAALEALVAADGPADDPVAELADRAARAVRAVHDLADDVAAPGSTLTAMLFRGARLGVVHVGDTRLYRLRDGRLTQVTHDHTYPWSLVDEGRLTPEEAAAHPQRATLLRALHRDLPGEPDLHLREVRDGDRYLLSSDGVHAVLGDDRLRDALSRPAPAAAVADDLLDRVLAEGAPDNVALVVVDAREGD